jgi:hypothetical protein
MDDDRFVIWMHGLHEPSNLLDHSNSIHPNTQFMMEQEEGGHPLLLVLFIYTVTMSLWATNSMGHKHKTHTNWYLNVTPHCHLYQEYSVLLTHAKQYLTQNQPSDQTGPSQNNLQEEWVISQVDLQSTPPPRETGNKQKQISMATLAYVQNLSDITAEHRRSTT